MQWCLTDWKAGCRWDDENWDTGKNKFGRKRTWWADWYGCVRSDNIILQSISLSLSLSIHLSICPSFLSLVLLELMKCSSVMMKMNVASEEKATQGDRWNRRMKGSYQCKLNICVCVLQLACAQFAIVMWFCVISVAFWVILVFLHVTKWPMLLQWCFRPACIFI